MTTNDLIVNGLNHVGRATYELPSQITQ